MEKITVFNLLFFYIFQFRDKIKSFSKYQVNKFIFNGSYFNK